MIYQGSGGRQHSGEGQSLHLHFCKLAECHQHPPPKSHSAKKHINLRGLSPPDVTKTEEVQLVMALLLPSGSLYFLKKPSVIKVIVPSPLSSIRLSL